MSPMRARSSGRPQATCPERKVPAGSNSTVIPLMPSGAILLFGYGLKFAGPVINTVGWPVVSLFTLCVAASMAELASAYPTACVLYFLAFRLWGAAGPGPPPGST